MTTYSSEEVREWLSAHLPTWRLEKSHLVRVYKTRNWRVTMLTANAIAFLAEAADHHPELILNYPSVEVHLETHSAGGITDKDFELARRMEETILWRPDAADALMGPPEGWVTGNPPLQ